MAGAWRACARHPASSDWLVLQTGRSTRVSFVFTPPATAQIYTLSLHDALPIFGAADPPVEMPGDAGNRVSGMPRVDERVLDLFRQLRGRSEEHTSELQSPVHLVCRLLLEKKKGQLSHMPVAVGAGIDGGRVASVRPTPRVF